MTTVPCIYIHIYSGRTYYVVNPIIEMEENTTESEDHNVRLTGNLEFRILPELNLITQYTYQTRKGERYALPVQPHTGR